MDELKGAQAGGAVRDPRRSTDRARLAVPPASGTALVAVAPISPADRSWTPARRPLAAFLAQLIATRSAAPQARLRRRAEPREALSAYLAASARRAQPHLLARSA